MIQRKIFANILYS